MTTLSDRLDIIESSLSSTNYKASDVPTFDQTEATRKEIFYRIESLQTSIEALELKASMLEETIKSS